MKLEDENGENKFYVTNYNNEIVKQDFIAEYILKDEEDLKLKKDKLIESISSSEDILDKSVNFQLVKASIGSKSIYFIYYRRVKISAVKRKNASTLSRMTTIRGREFLEIQQNDVIELGGKIELIIYDNKFYIISPRTLEYAFDYSDHVIKKRDENLNKLTNMNFFDDDSNIELFIEKSKQYIFTRRLAGMEDDTTIDLEEHFKKRCKELRDIKENMPVNPDEKKNYIKDHEVLWPLYDHIDVLEKMVRINPDKSIEPLVSFFTDKIVKSFLTNELREN